MMSPISQAQGDVRGRLKGKVAIVTGAAGGQGREAVRLFAQAGAIVLGCDINGDGLEQTLRVVNDEGLTADLAVIDAADPDTVPAWVDAAASRLGGIDILYNNGSSTHFASFEDMTIEKWRETLRLELDVVYVPTKAVWRHMIARGGGSIINIASMSGMIGSEVIAGVGQSAHAAGKGGVIALTRQLAVEGAPHWIRVNTISPGFIVTPAVEGLFHAAPDVERVASGTTPLPRLGHPADVVYTGIFLASDEAAFITGANLPVDGGITARAGVSSLLMRSDRC